MMLDRTARTVRRQFPESVTSVGHLSREGGGEIDQHRSHESGRDADVGFFVRDGRGRQLLASHFVHFRSDGSAPTWPGAVFDDAKNWALVSAMLADPQAHVTHIFVASPLRARLLAYAERSGAPMTMRVHAAEVMQQPHGALPHDDHFHVRIGCPGKMSGCVENPALRAHLPPLPRERGGVGRRGPRTVVASAAEPSTATTRTGTTTSARTSTTPSAETRAAAVAAEPAAPEVESEVDAPPNAKAGASYLPPAASMAAPGDDLDE
jgi:hypothetical protein